MLPGEAGQSGSINDLPAISDPVFSFRDGLVVAWSPLLELAREESTSPLEDPITNLKSATLCLQTAHCMSFSPTMFNALVRHAEQRGCLQGCKMARLDGRDARQTEQSEGEAECSESMTGVSG